MAMHKIKVNGGEPKSITLDGGQVIVDDQLLKWDASMIAEGTYHVLSGKNGTEGYRVEVMEVDPETKTYTLKVNGNLYVCEVADQYDLLLAELGLTMTAAVGAAVIKAPMPGLVLRIQVEAGQQVEKGQALIVLEAMKMENVLKAPASGIVAEIKAVAGAAVEKGEVLIQMG